MCFPPFTVSELEICMPFSGSFSRCQLKGGKVAVSILLLSWMKDLVAGESRSFAASSFLLVSLLF